MQDKPKLKIDWATYEAAKFACLNWHYSKCMPAAKLVKIGAWENKKFIGVIIFARGATPRLGKPYNLDQNECVELVRVALCDHLTPVSKITAIAIRILKKSNPKIRLIVSFADINQGHYGGIYQAGNWIYNGRGADSRFWSVNGKIIHPRTLIHKGGSNTLEGAKKIDANAKSVYMLGKHRYLMPLDNAMRDKIKPLSKPYPKRVKEQESGDHSDLGGATPTHTLHQQIDNSSKVDHDNS